MTAATTERLDGPGFAAWLREHGVTDSELKSWNFDRRFREWRQGEPASVWTADKLLTRLGLHLSMLPDALYEDAR